VITGTRLASGGLTTLACLHSASAEDTDSIKERRLRTAYCIGVLVAQQSARRSFVRLPRLEPWREIANKPSKKTKSRDNVS
jgi:hypothetical protein